MLRHSLPGRKLLWGRQQNPAKPTALATLLVSVLVLAPLVLALVMIIRIVKVQLMSGCLLLACFFWTVFVDALRKEKERESEVAEAPSPRRKTEPKKLQSLLGMLRRGEGSEDKKGAKKEGRGVAKTPGDTTADMPANDQVSLPPLRSPPLGGIDEMLIIRISSLFSQGRGDCHVRGL